MTPTELYEKILCSITQVRDVHNEQGRERMNHAWELYGDVVASDSLLDEMARAAQALVGLLPDIDGECGHCKRPIPDHTFCQCVEPRTP
jgi:hypothetical protein